MGASDALAAVPGDGLAVLDGAWFLGSLGVRVGGAGVASLANVVALDCTLCKDVDAIPSLTWAELPAGPKANLFCACGLGRRGISFNSTSAKLSAVLTMASTLSAQSDHGALSFDEVVLLPSSPSKNGSMPSLGPPSLTAHSTYGALAINGMIAPKAAAATVQVKLSSFAGDIKAVFSGGAISGSYDVTTAPGGIGHVGIVIDNTPTRATQGTLGSGNATVTIDHAYGNLALALSTKAPSVFAGISSGLLKQGPAGGGPGGRAGSGAMLEDEQPHCAGGGDSGGALGDGESHADADAAMGLQQPIWWMGPLAHALAAAGEAVDEARQAAEDEAAGAAMAMALRRGFK